MKNTRLKKYRLTKNNIAGYKRGDIFIALADGSMYYQTFSALDGRASGGYHASKEEVRNYVKLGILKEIKNP